MHSHESVIPADKCIYPKKDYDETELYCYTELIVLELKTLKYGAADPTHINLTINPLWRTNDACKIALAVIVFNHHSDCHR